MHSRTVKTGVCEKKRPTGGFTLVELLVVIGIIAMLISILLPVLGRARAAAVSVSCKSLLRQYAIASEMYISENNGFMVDAFKVFDYYDGLGKYLSGGEVSEKVARCPGDGDTEAAGRLGLLGAGTDPADPSQPWPLYRKDGSTFTVRVSIGCNQNSTSASRRPISGGKFGKMWIKRSMLAIPGADPSQTMVWADWQNNPLTANTTAYRNPAVAAIVTAGNTTDPLAGQIGSLCFRHNGVSNAIFLDGHVGEIAPLVKVGDNGLGLLEKWPTYSGMAEGYYPWAPRNNGGNYGVGVSNGGTMVLVFPGLTIR